MIYQQDTTYEPLAFALSDPMTSLPADADQNPVVTLIVGGVEYATVVTPRAGTGEYESTMTIPDGTAGKIVQRRISAYIGGSSDPYKTIEMLGVVQSPNQTIEVHGETSVVHGT